MLLCICAVVRFALFRYTTVWRYAGARDYLKFAAVDAIAFALYMLADRIIGVGERIDIKGYEYSGFVVPIASCGNTAPFI